MRLRSLLKYVRIPADAGLLHLFVDVDGVLTDGTFAWHAVNRKTHKFFGPDDSDALRRVKNLGVHVTIISADTVGGLISESRAEHMDMPFQIAPSNGAERYSFMILNSAAPYVLYIGDGYEDVSALRNVDFSFAPRDAAAPAKKAADVVLRNRGGHRAVAEAAYFIMEEFLNVK